MALWRFFNTILCVECSYWRCATNNNILIYSLTTGERLLRSGSKQHCYKYFYSCSTQTVIAMAFNCIGIDLTKEVYNLRTAFTSCAPFPQSGWDVPVSYFMVCKEGLRVVYYYFFRPCFCAVCRTITLQYIHTGIWITPFCLQYID